MIRVLVVDDHGWVRDGVAAVLDAADGLTVVGTAVDGRSALAEAARLRPDVVTLDVAMPGPDGPETAALLRQHHPAVRVIMLSVSVPGLAVQRAHAAGAVGYVLKAGDPEELVAAVRAAAAGGQWWCPQAAAVLRRAV